MGRILKQEIKSSFGGKFGYLFMRKNLKRFAKRMDSSEVGGAMILGVGSPCIKAHGSSDPHAIAMAIKQAEMMVKTDIIKKAQTRISELKANLKVEEGQNSNEE
jgi:glycerol-3-phosphate acyltransferase PlsX